LDELPAGSTSCDQGGLPVEQARAAMAVIRENVVRTHHMSKRRKKYIGWFRKTKQRRCAYCDIGLTNRGPTKMTADHVKPLVNHGYDKRKNVVACCYRCNQMKGQMSAQEFRQRLAFIKTVPPEGQ
jgi:5-methylcytosine-specific restriction endonuclease McrA